LRINLYLFREAQGQDGL